MTADFDTEQEWLEDRNDQWKKLRNEQTDEDTLAARGTLLNHPDIDEVPYESRGWEVGHGKNGVRKRLTFLVRRRGDINETINPPQRAIWSEHGPNTQWTLTQQGEGPVYKRKADSLLDAVRMSDTRPGKEHALSEEPFPNFPESSEAQHARTTLSELNDERLWDIKPFGRQHRESRVVGAVSRAGDNIWQ